MMITGTINQREIFLDQVNRAVGAQRFKSLLAAIVLSVPMPAFIYLFIRNVVTAPIDKMVSGLRSIARGEGDLSQRLEDHGRDEIQRLSGRSCRRHDPPRSGRSMRKAHTVAGQDQQRPADSQSVCTSEASRQALGPS
jgi:methyl-accepting chemotaxis protein